jgi:hypothetical protein
VAAFGGQVVLWIVGTWAWLRVKRVGFWFVAVLVHLGLLAQFVWLVGALYTNLPHALGYGGLWSLLLLFVLALQLWPPGVAAFFRKVDGRCPLCRAAAVGEPTRTTAWKCPHCGRQVRWLETPAR